MGFSREVEREVVVVPFGEINLGGQWDRVVGYLEVPPAQTGNRDFELDRGWFTVTPVQSEPFLPSEALLLGTPTRTSCTCEPHIGLPGPPSLGNCAVSEPASFLMGIPAIILIGLVWMSFDLARKP